MDVKVIVNASNALKELNSLPTRIREEVGSSFAKRGREIRRLAQKWAPEKSGKLKSNIYDRTYEKGMETTIGIYPTKGSSGFNYTPFVALQQPISIEATNTYFQGPQKVVYGKTATGPGGSPIVWTAQSPRWWFGIQEKARRSFPQIARSAVQKATK